MTAGALYLTEVSRWQPISCSVSELCTLYLGGRAAVRVNWGGLTKAQQCSLTAARPLPLQDEWARGGHSRVRKGLNQGTRFLRTHPRRGGAGHQGACLGRCLHHHHQVRRGGVQVNAGDHPSREVHQGVREIAVVQVEIGPVEPGWGGVRPTAGRPLRSHCSAGRPDPPPDLPASIRPAGGSSNGPPSPPSSPGQPHDWQYCVEASNTGAAATGHG